MKNLRRNTNYVFWSFTEQASVMAIPRLVLWPLAAYVIGKEAFGVFVFSLAITSIVGVQPGNGLATGLLRHLSDYDSEGQKQFCGSALRLCHLAMVVLVAASLLCLIVLGGINLVSPRVLYCLIPLTLSLYPENQTHLLLTESRFYRQFRTRALWFTFRSFLNLAGGYAGAKLAGLIGLVWGFTIGNALVYGILRFLYREQFRVPYDIEMGGVLKKIWVQITIAGVIAFAGPYLNRIVLGSIHGFNDTADLVAATGVTFIFLSPITCISALLLSVISRYNSIRDVSRSARVQLLCISFLGVIVCPLGLRLFASHIIEALYPGFGEESVRLLKILVWMVMSETVVCLCRPFVMKFGSLRLVPIINSVSLVATLMPAICLIPFYRAVGAAWAIVLGSVVAGGLWLIATGWICFRSALPVKAISLTEK
ncbi:MAG: hypothetical protein ABFD91_12830 [Anaerohalosphaeraceae bacterium]